ncbi:MerR family transcriptional regulator [Streptococcus dysgalactiae subsp. equisimilis 167]|nr:MerR family transcriptional regulator [Streptococcus dysgalactiae subsp. equisimilis 167]
MSQFYSTGELANLAGVSIRTVQYYDQRGILIPTALTAGGRRLYTDSDLEQLRMICFLRDLGFSIEQIRKVLAEENAAQVLELLLVDHIATAKEDLAAKEQQVDIAVKILDRLRKQDPQSLDFLMDISLSMKKSKSLEKTLYYFNCLFDSGNSTFCGWSLFSPIDSLEIFINPGVPFSLTRNLILVLPKYLLSLSFLSSNI